MVIAIAIHQIIQKPNPVEPGDAFELDQGTFDELFKLGAVRAANEEEVQLYRMSNGEPELPLKNDTGSDSGKKVEKAAEAADQDRAILESRAKAAGLSIDKRWGDARLLEEVVKAEEAKTNPDPEVTEL